MKHRIKKFIKEYFEQNNYGTAYPIYFVIKDIVWGPSYHFEDGDRYALINDCSVEFAERDLESLFKRIEQETDYEFPEDFDFEFPGEFECKQFCKLNNGYSNLMIFAETQVEIEKGMFLLRSDAELHLKQNAHHYSQEAYIYCKHAWRCDNQAEFFNDLKEYFNGT